MRPAYQAATVCYDHLHNGAPTAADELPDPMIAIRAKAVLDDD